MLEVSELNQYYGESHTLWDVDLDVEEGRCTCLVGRNGMGKTTLLKAIMGLVPSDSGKITLGEQELAGKPASQRARSGIGYVPQGRDIFSELTVEENLLISLAARRDGKREVPGNIYEFFPVLFDMRGRRGGDLSGGQQQQLAIGRALALGPDLLIMDEPTEGIQPNIVSEIGDLIGRLTSELGVTVLLVEQKLPFVRKVADRFCVMDKGRSVASGGIDGLDEDNIARHLSV